MINWAPIRAVLMFLILALFGASISIAQDEEQSDPLSRDTPRDSIEGYLTAAEKGDFEDAANYLDLRNLPEKADRLGGPELAKKLFIILQRSNWVDLQSLSDQPEGLSDDGLPSYRDVLRRIDYDGSEVTLLVQLVPSDSGASIWKVSNVTVARLPDIYQQYGYGKIVEAIANAVPDVYFLGIKLFKWIIAVGAGLAFFPFMFFLAWYGTRVIISPKSPTYKPIRRFLSRPVTALFVFLVMRWTSDYLGLGVGGRKIVDAATIITIVSLWVGLSLIDLVRGFLINKLIGQDRDHGVMFLKPMGGALKGFILVLALLVWLDNIGVNITALLTGLGVGGIAVALALQKPLEDVFAAMTLFTIRPVKVGDYCCFEKYHGTIENIGLRNTRIRTTENSIISVPNARFAQEYIENISAREMIRYNPNIRLRNDASKEVVEKVLVGIRNLLKKHKKVDQKRPRVRFADFEDNALKLNIKAFIKTTDYNEYLQISEELNLGIIKIVKAAGTSLAVPFVKIQPASPTKL